MKTHNRIALIAWSIIAAVVVCFFLTIGDAKAEADGTDPYAKVGHLTEGSIMDVWGEFFSEEQQLQAVKMGHNCHYMATATSAILESPDGGLVEMADTLIDEVVDCQQMEIPDPQLRTMIETGFTVVPYFEEGTRSLDPEDLVATLKKNGFKTVATCVAEVYLITVFLPHGESIHEELAIARVLDRQCTPVKK